LGIFGYFYIFTKITEPTRNRTEFLEYPNGSQPPTRIDPIPEKKEPNPSGYPNAHA